MAIIAPHGHHGYATIVDPDHSTIKYDTVQCGHCDAVIYLKPGSGITVYMIVHRDGRWTEEMGAFCRVCMRPVCLQCHDIGACLPFEKQLERMEGKR
jgi:hypothetical protein